jgi:hypothetical protein
MPDVLEASEEDLIESPSGIAFGISGGCLIVLSFWSGTFALDGLLNGSQELS